MFGDLFLMRRAGGAAGAAPGGGRAARGSPSRYRPLRPGDVRGSVLPSDHSAAAAAAGFSPTWRLAGRLRRQLGRQRQGAADDGVPAGLCTAGRRGRRRRRARRGVLGLAATGRQSGLLDGPRPLGTRIFRPRARRVAGPAGRRDRSGGVPGSPRRRRRRALPRDRHRGGGRQGGRLVPGTHGMGPTRAGRPLDRLRPAAGGHEADTQRQDQTPRELPSLRPVGARPRGGRVVRGGRRRPLHDPGVPGSRRKAGADAGGDPRRWLGPAADRSSRGQSPLLRADRGLRGDHRNADGAEHVVQRERAGRLPSRGGAGLLPAHPDGPAGARRLLRRAAANASRRGGCAGSARALAQP